MNINVGDTVTWKNNDGTTHTASKTGGPGPKFDTGNISSGATSAPVTFDTAGTMTYRCNIRTNMTGTIQVNPEGLTEKAEGAGPMSNARKGKRDKKGTRGHRPHGPRDDRPHGHRPHDPPYYDPDYRHPPDHGHEPPDNPRYPDSRIYGDYASKRPPRYVPHPFEHTCFKPRKEDYKPPTTCDDHDDELCVRKDHRTLTADEQSRFLNAFTQINAMNALGPLVDIHSNAIHQLHSNPRFLPWHRVYLLRMEELLMTVDPTVCIPYWKSSEEQAFPSWLLGFTPTVNLMGGPHTVSRNIGGAFLPNAAAVATAVANGTFNTFAPALEGVHNSGHVWVGGSMGGILTAPTDPVFWMHHAEIDRIWAAWQTANPGQNPTLAGAAATMDPWTETEVDTRDITALGYTYV